MSEEAERAIAKMNEVFERDVGTWDAESQIRRSPTAAPISMRGVYRNRPIAGGRWLAVDYQSDSGFEGHGVYGWDPARGAYVGIWVDSTESVMARSEGRWDEATRTMTYVTEADRGGSTFRYREITQAQDDGSLLYRNLMPAPGGGEFEMVRIVYRRRS
jgi:hypothetical protein